MRAHNGMAGQACSVIDAARKVKTFFAMIGIHRLPLFLKCLHRANNRAVRIEHGHGPDVHQHLVSCLVMHISDGFCRVRGLDGAFQRTALRTKFTARLIAMERTFRHAGVAHNLMAAYMARDPFRAVTPENDFLLRVDHAEPIPGKLSRILQQTSKS